MGPTYDEGVRVGRSGMPPLWRTNEGLVCINPPAAIQKILACLGLPTRAPRIAPAVPDADAVFSQ
jgi:hypothetical protein